MGQLGLEHAVLIQQVEYDGILVRTLHGLDRTGDGGPGGAEVRILDQLEGVFDGLGIERRPILEGDPFPQLDGHGQTIFRIFRFADRQQGIIRTGLRVDAVQGLIDLSVDIGGGTVVCAQGVKAGKGCGEDDVEHLSLACVSLGAGTGAGCRAAGRGGAAAPGQQAEAQSTGRSKADEFLPSFHGILSFSYGLY